MDILIHNKLAVDIGTTFFGHGSGNPLLSLAGVGTLVNSLVNNIFVIAGVVLLFVIIYAGTAMVTGAGDPQSFERAKSILTAGIIGFVLVIAAWLIVRIVETSTGVTILS